MTTLSCVSNNTKNNWLIAYTESGNDPINIQCRYESGILTVNGTQFEVGDGCYPYLSAYRNRTRLKMNVYGINVDKSEGLVVFCHVPGTYAYKLNRVKRVRFKQIPKISE